MRWASSALAFRSAHVVSFIIYDFAVDTPARLGGPLSAIDSINVSNCGFSEELSRKVLTSLKGLTDAIATVRDSVSKIDTMAQSQNIAPSSFEASSALSKPVPALVAPPPVPQKSAMVESLLKSVCLSAAQAGVASSWDEHTLSQLKQVRDFCLRLRAARAHRFMACVS